MGYAEHRKSIPESPAITSIPELGGRAQACTDRQSQHQLYCPQRHCCHCLPVYQSTYQSPSKSVIPKFTVNTAYFTLNSTHAILWLQPLKRTFPSHLNSNISLHLVQDYIRKPFSLNPDNPAHRKSSRTVNCRSHLLLYSLSQLSRG